MANGHVCISIDFGTRFAFKPNGIHTSDAGIKCTESFWNDHWCLASKNAVNRSTGETKTLQYAKIFLRHITWIGSSYYVFCFIQFELGLALASLLPVQDDIIYQRFDVLIQCICETLNDIMKEDIEYKEEGNESHGLVEYAWNILANIWISIDCIFILYFQFIDFDRRYANRWWRSIQNGAYFL